MHFTIGLCFNKNVLVIVAQPIETHVYLIFPQIVPSSFPFSADFSYILNYQTVTAVHSFPDPRSPFSVTSFSNILFRVTFFDAPSLFLFVFRYSFISTLQYITVCLRPQVAKADCGRGGATRSPWLN